MQRFGIRRLGAMLSLVLALGLVVAGFSVVQARQSDPTVDGPGTPRPGHIHSGTCEGGGLGDVVYAFNSATIDNLDEDADSSGDSFAGSEDANPVYVSETTIDGVTLDDILAEPHAINFHLSGDELSTYIACGEIGGFARDGVLYVGLVPVAEFPDTQFAGSAILTDNGDNTITAVVQLVELPAADGSTTAPGTAATPASTPIVTVPDESVAPSADASIEESVAPSADASVEESVAPSADASVEESIEPIESEAPIESDVPAESEAPVESTAPDEGEDDDEAGASPSV